jgi:hypothetical protein
MGRAQVILSHSLGGLRAVTPRLSAGFTSEDYQGWAPVDATDVMITRRLADGGFVCTGVAVVDPDMAAALVELDLVHLDITTAGHALLHALIAELYPTR